MPTEETALQMPARQDELKWLSCKSFDKIYFINNH